MAKPEHLVELNKGHQPGQVRRHVNVFPPANSRMLMTELDKGEF
jgi:hypothetical protein